MMIVIINTKLKSKLIICGWSVCVYVLCNIMFSCYVVYDDDVRTRFIVVVECFGHCQPARLCGTVTVCPREIYVRSA